tara:strand:- start:271 stop:2466 length:2196 start_codon:yes stop_codon:yes gene_type:complete
MLAAGLKRLETLTPRYVSRWILELARALEELSIDDLLFELNAERIVSGFPPFSDIPAVEAGVRERRLYFRRTIESVLDSLSFQEKTDVLLATVKTATEDGTVLAPILVDDLVDSYDVKLRAVLEEQERIVRERCDELRPDYIKLPKLEFMLGDISSAVKTWYRAAQPILLSRSGRGLDLPEPVSEVKGVVEFLLSEGGTYIDGNQYEEGKKFYRCAAAISSQGFGAMETDLDEIVEDLILQITEADEVKCEDAMELYEVALDLVDKHLDGVHPSLLYWLRELADCYVQLNWFSKAIDCYERVLESPDCVLWHHSELVDVLQGIASCFLVPDGCVTCIPLIHDALDAIEECLAGAMDIHEIVKDLVDRLMEAEETSSEDAIYRYELVSELIDKYLGGVHQDSVVFWLQQLADGYANWNESTKAITCLQRVLYIMDCDSGSDLDDIIDGLQKFAEFHLAQDDFVSALPLFQRALYTIEEYTSGMHPELMDLLDNLAHCYSESGEYETAVCYYQRALLLRVAPSEAKRLDLANFICESENISKSSLLYRWLLQDMQMNPRSESDGLIRHINSLIHCHNALGEHVEAEFLYRCILDIVEEHSGVDDSRFLRYLSELESLYRELGENDKAETLRLQSVTIVEGVLEPDHPDFVEELVGLKENVSYDEVDENKLNFEFFDDFSHYPSVLHDGKMTQWENNYLGPLFDETGMETLDCSNLDNDAEADHGDVGEDTVGF